MMFLAEWHYALTSRLRVGCPGYKLCTSARASSGRWQAQGGKVAPLASVNAALMEGSVVVPPLSERSTPNLVSYTSAIVA